MIGAVTFVATDTSAFLRMGRQVSHMALPSLVGIFTWKHAAKNGESDV